MLNKQIVGIIPAAGKATRLGHLPLSKEIYPIGFEKMDGINVPKVVSSYLFENFAEAGITEIHFILRQGKWDIPAYFGSGDRYKVNICYHLARYGYGVPFSVNQAYPFIKDKIVALGFPDILIDPRAIYVDVIKTLLASEDYTMVLGLIPTDKPDIGDMTEYDEDLMVKDMHVKSQEHAHLKYTWIVAVWKPEFTAFLNDFILKELSTRSEKELAIMNYQMGDSIVTAIKTGMKAKAVLFEHGSFLDIGTPEDLRIAGEYLKKYSTDKTSK